METVKKNAGQVLFLSHVFAVNRDRQTYLLHDLVHGRLTDSPPGKGTYSRRDREWRGRTSLAVNRYPYRAIASLKQPSL